MGRHFYRNLLTIVAFSIFLFDSPSLFAAQSEEETKQALIHLQKQKKDIEQDIGVIEAKKHSALLQLRKVERKYGEVAKKVRDLQRDVGKQQDQLAQLKKQRNWERQKSQNELKALKAQLRTAHAAGPQDRLKLLLNQDDAARVSRMLVYYDYFNRSRLSRLETIREKLADLATTEVELSAETHRLSQLIGQEREESEKLMQARQSRNALLTKLGQRIQYKKNELGRLKHDTEGLQKLLKSIQAIAKRSSRSEDANKPFNSLKGRLEWPVKGALIKRFGSRRKTGRWDGVLIRAKGGVSVRAVSSGRIVYAEWLRGYGLLTIIDHGGGYMSLYAFNESLYKEVGERVNTGDIVATVGQSNGRSQPGLYFGIRKNGKPLDPMAWCRKSKQGQVG